jgi:ribosomal protein S6E (S10)
MKKYVLFLLTVWATMGATSAHAQTQLGSDLDGEAADDFFGNSVALSYSGDTMAVAAPLNDGVNGSGSGHVRVFAYDANSGSWTQLGSDIDGEAAGDTSGVSVSLSADGRRVAIGAPRNDGNDTTNSRRGHTRIYEYNTSNSSWTQLGSDIDGEAAGDFSGVTVSLSADGGRVAIGAPLNDDGPGFTAGHTRIYEYNTTNSNWTQLGSDIEGEAADDNSGWSVSLSADGRRVAIGAIGNDGNGSNAGHTRIYEYNTSNTSWTQLGSDIDGEAGGDLSGYSVSLSADGNRVAIGAIYNDFNVQFSGHTRIYEYNASSSSWTQQGGDIDGEAADDYSGFSVSLSANGRRVAIGALGNDGNGSDAGHTRIYEFNATTTSWTQLGSDIDGEAVGDESGFSVSLSADGNRVAIGAPYNDGNGIDAGHVRVFQLSAPAFTKEEQATTVGHVQVFANENALILRDKSHVLDPATQIRLFDLTGREVLRAPATAQEVISLDGLNPGIYLYRLDGPTNQQAGKVTVR